MVARHPPCAKQPFQPLLYHHMIQRLYQLFAEPKLTVFGTHTQIGDIQRVSVRLVRSDVSVRRNPGPGMMNLRGIRIKMDLQSRDRAGQFSVHFNT
ncbi:hypothetical protein D3C85_1597420 [compost metagenome]